MRALLVTGTSTGVGKTVATAALAVTSRQSGQNVAVVKPVQTGVDEDLPTDMECVARLTGHGDCHELVGLPEPLAPESAARRAAKALPPMAAAAARIADLAADHTLAIVEGAGGLLVRLDLDGGTMLTLAGALDEREIPVSFVVVTGLALGTLNHTELTVRAIERAGHRIDGLVLGSVPAELGLAERCNLDDLPRLTGQRVVAAIPADVGEWDAERFTAAAPGWFTDRDWAGSTSAES